ncbi:hypothetical protein AGMMS49573_10090 [Endomicrobiia bacterium]|nr:hypothetical protein AGMMS49573_10090 [Endomicrobiia bacterium]
MFSFGFSSCDEGEGSDDYGFGYIYMPQATVTGGLNNNYYVPAGEGVYTYNFKIDVGKKELQIILGVLRAGVIANAEYSVDIIARTDTTNQILAEGLVENGIAFPQNLYSLPSKITVPKSKSGDSFYMTVSTDALKNDAYTDKKLVLAVAVRNPTHFELAPENTNTVVILDVNTIRTHIANAENGK